MALRPVPREKWIQFLKDQGLEKVRTKGSHDIWDHPGRKLTRPIVFRTKDRDIPRLHLETCLKTLGMSVNEFMAKIADL